jgi:hypothetical protein
MTVIPHFVQNEVNTDASNRISAFNFCDPFDHILPVAVGTVGPLARQHLWGMYQGIAAAGTSIIPVFMRDYRNRRVQCF